MVFSIALALLAQADFDCEYSARSWQKNLSLPPPCIALKRGVPSAMKAWGLTKEQANCVAEGWKPTVRHDSESRIEGRHEVWKRCLERWPLVEVFWFGTLRSSYEHGPLPVESLASLDGGVALAERLLKLDRGPGAEFAEVVIKASPERLASLFGQPALESYQGFSLALRHLEHPPARGFSPLEWETLGRVAIEGALDAGLLQLAAETWMKLPATTRLQLSKQRFARRYSHSLEDGGVNEIEEGDRRPTLALALAAAGHLEEAKSISRPTPDAGPDDRDRDRTARDLANFRIADRRTEAWENALEARADDDLPAELLDVTLDWVSPYESLLEGEVEWALSEKGSRQLDDLPADVRARAEQARAIARERLRLRAAKLTPQLKEPDAGTVTLPTPPWPWVERRTPAPKNPTVPLPRLRGFWPIRAERQGTRTVVLSASQRLDPTGEVSRGGFWLSVSTADGPWSHVYLGFADHRPFTPRERSKVPLLDAKNVVRIEVDEAPIDDTTLSFPPVCTRAPTKRSGIFLETTLAKLELDTDGDGLSDLVEARMLLDPKSKDSDGDGIVDGIDATPRLADGLPPTPTAEALNAFFESFSERDQPQALVVPPGLDGGLAAAVGRPREADLDDVRLLLGSNQKLAGLHPLSRIITLTEAELDAANRVFGLSFPMGLEVHVSTDGNHALIIWSEDWRGGTARADRVGGVWKITMLQQWIT